MRSARPKMLHSLAGRPLIERVLDLLSQAGANSTVVVLGYQADQIRRALPESVDTVLQEPQLGTGHAVQVAAARIKATGAERSDASPAERSVREIWSGSMLFWTPWLWQHLADLPRSPKGEYYLPELVNLARAAGLGVRAVLTEDEQEVHGVNDRLQLAEANAILRRRTLDELMLSGVTIVDPATTYIEPEVTIEPDVVIQPGCHLRGATHIARDCEIGPNTYVLGCTVGAGSRVWFSVIEGATIGEGVSIGPFSHLRPGAVIEDGATLGNYAEVKNSRIGAGTQMHHFAYVGDADIGERVNVAAGTITVNFSSETGAKSRTVVEDDASLGSDTLLVAPVHIGAGAMTGAGAVVTHDIPSGEVWLGAPARPHRRRRGYGERTDGAT